MRTLSLSLSLSLAALLAPATGCGHEIGDSCALSSECSPNGDRICDQSSPGGYCTILGCEPDTCPDGSVCIRFFSVDTAEDSNLTCETDADCAADDLCTLGGSCVPRLAEIRYCMKTCGNDGDCRGDYECRDEALMELHGGEPVPEPGQPLGDDLQSFCAPAPIVSE